MEFVKIITSNSEDYSYKDASNIEMNILSNFLTDDVGSFPCSFREWLYDEKSEYACCNITIMEKDNSYILLSDLYSEEENPTILKMTREQFLQVLTDWEEKVLKLRPKEVIIKYENDKFIFETK